MASLEYSNWNQNDMLSNPNNLISLEPRLSEYLNKKKFFEENNIDIDNLERKYSITKRDLVRIEAYQKGDLKSYNKTLDDDINPNSEVQFESEKLEKDPRLDRIKQRQDRDREANDQRSNYGIISKRYDMYRNDTQFATASGDNFTKKNPNIAKQKVNKNSMANTNTYNVKTSNQIKRNNFSNKSRHNGYLPLESQIQNDSNSLNEIINQLDNINTTNKTNQNEVQYKNMPFMSGQGSADVDVDSFVRHGETPSRSGKSLGYPNPVEHYFNYISSDLQEPDNVVSFRPADTRHLNKKTARDDFNINNRDIMQ